MFLVFSSLTLKMNHWKYSKEKTGILEVVPTLGEQEDYFPPFTFQRLLWWKNIVRFKVQETGDPGKLKEEIIPP